MAPQFGFVKFTLAPHGWTFKLFPLFPLGAELQPSLAHTSSQVSVTAWEHPRERNCLPGQGVCVHEMMTYVFFSRKKSRVPSGVLSVNRTTFAGGIQGLVWDPAQEQCPGGDGLGEALSGPEVTRVRCCRGMGDGDLLPPLGTPSREEGTLPSCLASQDPV